MAKNGISAREDFDLAVQVFAGAFGTSPAQAINDFRPTQSRLRLEQAAITTTTRYLFPVMVNQGGALFNTEVRLNLQDSFVPTNIGFYMGAPTGPTDATFPLKSYLNPFTFGAANAAAMGSIYNGNLSIMIDNVQYVNNWPLWWHNQVPQTQATAAPAAGSPLDEFDGDSYSLRSMQPFVILQGSKNVVISIQLQAAPTQVTTNSRLILVFDGILFQNSTVVG